MEIDDKRTKISRDTLVDLLTAENIIARRYFYLGCHPMEPYRSFFPHAGPLLPETEQLCMPSDASTHRHSHGYGNDLENLRYNMVCRTKC